MKEMDKISYHIKLYTQIYDHDVNSSKFFEKISKEISDKLLKEADRILDKINYLKMLEEL